MLIVVATDIGMYLLVGLVLIYRARVVTRFKSSII